MRQRRIVWWMVPTSYIVIDKKATFDTFTAELACKVWDMLLLFSSLLRGYFTSIHVRGARNKLYVFTVLGLQWWRCRCVSSLSGFLRSDKPIGTALLKLDKLETQSEIREIVEVSDKSQEGVLQVSLILSRRLASLLMSVTLILASGDGWSKGHRRSRWSEGPTPGASERTGHADEHRALAGDRSVTGNMKETVLIFLLLDKRNILSGFWCWLCFISKVLV